MHDADNAASAPPEPQSPPDSSGEMAAAPAAQEACGRREDAAVGTGAGGRSAPSRGTGYVDLNRVRGARFGHCRRIGEFLDGDGDGGRWSGDDGRGLLVPEKDLAKWKGCADVHGAAERQHAWP